MALLDSFDFSSFIGKRCINFLSRKPINFETQLNEYPLFACDDESLTIIVLNCILLKYSCYLSLYEK